MYTRKDKYQDRTSGRNKVVRDGILWSSDRKVKQF